jgi:hypothetical protein
VEDLSVFVSPCDKTLPEFVRELYVILTPAWRIGVQIDPWYGSLSATMHVTLDEKDGTDSALVFRTPDPNYFCVEVYRHMPREHRIREFGSTEWKEAAIFIVGDMTPSITIDIDLDTFKGLLG